MEKMNEVPKADMSKDQLILLCEHLEQKLVEVEAVNRAYKKHLEEVIEYQSVERYRETVQKNREAVGTAPQNSIVEQIDWEKRLHSLNSEIKDSYKKS